MLENYGYSDLFYEFHAFGGYFWDNQVYGNHCIADDS